MALMVPRPVLVIKTYSFLLLALPLLLLAPRCAQAADDTLVFTLRGLPPPATSPPPAAHPGYPAYRQPPVQAPPPTLPAPRRDVVGRLGMCEVNGAPIYRGRNEGGGLLVRIAQGTPLAIKTEYAGWYAVLMADATVGWIPKSAVRLLEYNVVRPQPSTPTGPPPSVAGLGGEVLQEAFNYLGVPYVWGGNGYHGLDCSGLVKNCFAHCGIELPRRASEQARVGRAVPLDVAYLQPGDRLYFAVGRPSIDHTAIYLGNGYFIHASMSRGKVAVDHLSRPLFRRHLVAAMRI
jgi:cell wall-associated NlpC family hydrolase